MINTLRNRMGKIVVIFLAFSMGAFILTDLFQSNSFLFGGGTDIAEMASTTVTYQEFQEKIEEVSISFSLNTGRNPTSEEMNLIRQQAWQELITDKVFGPQFQQLGIEVTDEEMVEMVQGTNIHPAVRQAFTNPQTGVFDKDQLIAYLQQLNSLPPQNKAAWINFEANLRPQRAQSKYESLFALTDYANKYEAKNEYFKTGSSASIDFLFVPFFSVPDSVISLSESDLEDYLEDHEDEYEREETKDVSYVVFDIVPSAEDSAVIQQEVADILEGLRISENDSLYASINSDGLNPYQSYNPGSVPEEIRGLELGDVTEPKLEDNRYIFYKLSAVEEGEEYFLRARHILFKWDDETDQAKSEARARANGILADIRRGADFEEMARIHGTDGTASQGGDLGWFGENGNFVEEFKEACFGFRGTGVLRNLVETQFGYHIIEVTEPKVKTAYKVATIEKELFVGDQTLNDIYRQAELFSSQADSRASFAKKADEFGLKVQNGRRIEKNDRRVGNVPNARNIVFWLYNSASVGDVSEVFEIDDKYVVVIQTDYQEKGLAQLYTVRNEVTRKVKDLKKTAWIMEKLKAAEGNTLQEIADAYGEGARVSSNSINLNTASISEVGYAPEAVGVAFSLEEGERTAPFKVDNGIIILYLTEKNLAGELDDYSPFTASVLNTRRGLRRREEPFIDQNLYNAVVEFADIEDMRYKFF